MAQAATHEQMSVVRKQHAAHPHRPKPASKPGEPASAAARRGGGRKTGNGESKRGSASPSHGGGSSHSGEARGNHQHSGLLPGGKTLELPGGKTLELPGLQEIGLPKPHLSIWSRLALKLLKRLAKHELRKLAKASGKRLASAAPDALAKPDTLEKAGEALEKPREALERTRDAFDIGSHRPALPIQQSIDVAVPLDFVWQKWMELGFLPEGVDQVVEIERNGRTLDGRIEGDSDSSWSAEILDERERESFAWRSTEGSDCAGLVTFHRLSDRLTRIELTLDVVPRDVTEAAALLTHIADWRALKEMRKFKADLELVSPDVYASDADSSSQ